MTTPTGGSGGPNNQNTWYPPNPHAQHPPQYIAQHPPQPPPPIYTNLPPPPRTPQQHQHYSTQQTPTRQPPRPGGAPEPPAVLLALAETYFEAAHKSGYAVAVKRPGEEALDAQAYCKLVATGLGCLEAALQYRLQPRVEAMVRLRYASVLFDETDNLDEAEEALNKGIFMAGRNNLTDIKYSMQHLLARIMFKNSQKVAQKMVATLTTEAETLDLPLWNYSFRFLAFSLLMEHPTTRDDQAATHILQRIYTLAESRRDVAIMAICSLMEAMLFLVSGVDGVDHAQTALSRASAQVNSNHPMPPQIAILTQVLDIICSIMTARGAEGEAKIKVLHAMLDEKERWSLWRADGEFELPIHTRGHPAALKMRWLGKDDVFTLGYFLSGLAKYQRNLEENGKAERFLLEGLACIDRITEHTSAVPASLSAARSKLVWKHTLKAHMLTYYIFIVTLRTDWDKALHLYNAQLLPLAASLPLHGTPLGNLITYLTGTLAHGTNDPHTALHHYSLLTSSLPESDALSICAKLNTILILRSQDKQHADYLMSTLEPRCSNHRNENIKAAFIAVKATDETHPLVKTKNFLSLALRCASAAANHQLTFVILAFMCKRFFSGVVSEQAEKSARAALQNANRGRDNLWSYVSGEMYADCLNRKGNTHEAERQLQMNAENAAKVVRNLTRHMPAHPIYPPAPAPPPPPPPPQQHQQHQHQQHQQQQHQQQYYQQHHAQYPPAQPHM